MWKILSYAKRGKLMLKKCLITLCLVILVAGIVVGTMLPATAAESKYQVGYARVDINP